MCAAIDKNRIERNWFEGCAIGVHFTAGSERNSIAGNAFVRNRTQVMYVGTRALDWSVNGRGNYWSDDPAFDLNGDGIADTAYRPNDIIDKVEWSYPTAKLLMNSPAVQVIRWAQSQFPALHPGGVIDSAPLMKPPFVPPADGEALAAAIRTLAADPGRRQAMGRQGRCYVEKHFDRGTLARLYRKLLDAPGWPR